MCVTGAVELMRTMMAKSKRPGHLWPMAMYSWEVMPPPAGLEKNLGERRLTGHAGTGQSLLRLFFMQFAPNTAGGWKLWADGGWINPGSNLPAA